MLDNNVELLPASSVAAVEVYQGVGTPVQYGSDACGVVLIWTRRGN
jgi:outer membrane cobalamin receptor